MIERCSDKSKDSNRLSINSAVELSPIEQNIYYGLKSFGREISSFYLDAKNILYNGQFESNAYLVAHLFREIEGGLRDILSPLSNKNDICAKNGHKISKMTHFEEICSILGVPETNDLANKWKSVAEKFPKYAHRTGGWNEPRRIKEIEKIFQEFDVILFKLVGNHLNLLNQMDKKLAISEPTDKFLLTLPNLLYDNSLKYYFFKELKSPEWFLPLKEKGFFSPKQIYGDATSLVDYITRVGKHNSNQAQVKIIEELIQIINDCIDYRILKISEENPHIVDSAILELCSYLPIEKIPNKVIKILESSIKAEPNFSFVIMSSMDNFIPYLLKNKNDELFEEFIKVILDFDVKAGTYPDYEAKINNSQLFDLLRKAKKSIIENYSEITLKVVIEIINEILISDPDAFSYWQVATIEDSSQLSFYDRYQVQLVQLVREILLVYDRTECEKILKEWLKSKHTIYRRIAIFLINKRYVEYKPHFWNLEGNPLDDNYCLHELYQLFIENSKEFSEDEISKILEWIEKADYFVSDYKTEEQKQKIIALRKREWLSAFSESENEIVKQKIIEYQKIDNTPLDHPGHIIWHKTIYGFKSPINIRDFKESTVDEVVRALEKIKYANDSEALDNRGINIQLADLVKNDPMKFSDEIKKFNELSISFNSDVINGLTNAWQERKQFNWGSTLDFILDIIKDDFFWQKDYEGGYDFRDSFIRYVCEMLAAGTQNDDNAFDEKYLNRAEEILLIFDQNVYDSGNGFNDAATHYLNSTFGKFYDALLNLSLRFARVHKESKNVLWLPSIKNIFNRRLDRNSESALDIFICLGGFLPNFIFLDRQWVNDNINLIFPKENEPHWQAAIEGYLSFVRRYHESNYLLLRKNNHILKAINSDFDRQIAENLFAHIFFAHLSGLEKLDEPESMLSKIIESEKYNSTIAHFLWAQRDNPDVTSEIIFPIWKRIFDKVSLILEDEENERIISNLTQLLCYFETIPGDLFEMLSFSTKYLKSGFGTVHFVEELNRLRKKELDKVGQLFSKLLDNDDYPTYKSEHIIEIIEELYTNGYKELANNICNRYAKKGILFLRELYDKYNKN